MTRETGQLSGKHKGKAEQAIRCTIRNLFRTAAGADGPASLATSIAAQLTRHEHPCKPADENILGFRGWLRLRFVDLLFLLLLPTIARKTS
jgi:hypothetical protein